MRPVVDGLGSVSLGAEEPPPLATPSWLRLLPAERVGVGVGVVPALAGEAAAAVLEVEGFAEAEAFVPSSPRFS